jgi:carbamoyltransferase
MKILGLSFDYHDAAAALVVDGRPVAAAHEERFTRVKHDRRLPENAARWCLEKAGVSAADLDAVVFYEKPFRKFSRIMTGALETFPRSAAMFRRAAGAWLDERLWVRPRLERAFDVPASKVLFSEHHMSHAASAFYASPFSEAAVLVVDGVGEWATVSIGRGFTRPDGKAELRLDAELRYPDSIGLLYAAFTAYLGFEVNEGEYKVMGLAPYGRPRFVEEIRRMIPSNEDGSFRLELDWFAFHRDPVRAYSRLFEEKLGPARPPDGPDPSQDPRFCDIAASVQQVCEERVLALAKEAKRLTGCDNLCMAGGVALNAVANARVLREGPFSRVWIQPAAGDAGGALGAALYAAHVNSAPARWEMRGVAWGPEYSAGSYADALRAGGLNFEEIGDDARLCERAADLLSKGQVLGWHRGRSEWGPRSLGHRSILADPRSSAMRDRVNASIKFREGFRPFAPSVAAEAAAAHFEFGAGGPSAPHRFMLAVAPSRRPRELAAVSHVDGSSRVQCVDAETNPSYHRVISDFGRATGTPVVLNTSFNLKGEPIVETPSDAVSTFLASGLDALVAGPFLARRGAKTVSRRQSWTGSAAPSDGLVW